MDAEYDPHTRYAQYDIRKACEENASLSISTFAVSTQENSRADMEIMFPGRRFVILQDIGHLPRILPRQCKAIIKTSSWVILPIFTYLQKAGNIPINEMMRIFNNGLGLVIVVNEEDTGEVLLRLKAMGETAYPIGSVESRDDKEEAIQFTD